MATCSGDGAKVDRVLYHLKNVQRTDQGAKTIIFSQFISFLRLLDCKIKEQLNIESRLVGIIGKKIENTIEKFRSDNDTLVMLIPIEDVRRGHRPFIDDGKMVSLQNRPWIER